MFLLSTLIAFICAAANHLGLVAAAERVIRHRLPVLNCAKCSAFWATLACGVFSSGEPTSTVVEAVTVLATALLMAWLAVWMELAMGALDVIYNKVYDTLYPTAGGGGNDPLSAGQETDSHADEQEHPLDVVPDVW